MKKWWICTLCSVFSVCIAFSQEDRRLVERLDSTLRLTELSDLDKLLDYTYPKLFTIVPRDQVLSALKSGLVNDEFEASVDSVKRVRVFPVFTSGKGQYAKVTHTMRMNMKFKETIDTSGGEAVRMLQTMEEMFGKGNVVFNFKTNTVSVMMIVTMVAIKDEHSPDWTFVTFDDNEEDHELGTVLFSEEVLQKLKTYQ